MWAGRTQKRDILLPGSVGWLQYLSVPLKHACGVGTSISNGLITVRKMADPNFVQQNETPNIVLNSLAWTLHMGVSSNVRYQMLNGLDMVRPRPGPHIPALDIAILDLGISRQETSTAPPRLEDRFQHPTVTQHATLYAEASCRQFMQLLLRELAQIVRSQVVTIRLPAADLSLIHI